MNHDPIFTRARRAVAGARFALLATLASPAAAESPALSPGRLAITAPGGARELTVHNPHDTRAWVQATAYTWRHFPDGGVALERTQDLRMDPPQLRLEAGESATIRITHPSAPTPAEKAYRVVVDSVPPLHGVVNDDQAVVDLMRTSVAVFVAGTRARSAPRIGDGQLVAQRASFVVGNDGTSHLVTRRVEIVGYDASGLRLFTESFRPFYVLPGGARTFSSVLPEIACLAARIEVRGEAAGHDLFLELGPGRCER
jgi:P pilus assembly chaperone PapD